jgi:hypothetical protein
MENTITRIADLPESVNGGGGYAAPTMNALPTSAAANGAGAGIPTNYIPMNVHPNPYGNSTQNQVMSNPQQTKAPPMQQQFASMPPPQSQYLSEEHQAQMQNIQHQRLPSRDIAQDTTIYAQDEQIQPNYIPRARQGADYVRDYEDMTDRNVREYEDKKRKESRLDQLLTEFQTPIFLIALFFFYQMPVMNNLVFKKFSFLSIYNNDGNFNFYGLLLKSVLFGFSYYSISKSITYLSEI